MPQPQRPQQEARPFGRYELLERIASGGMGEIYLARMRGAANFEKRCVIKKILPHLASEEAFVTKFIDEANLVVQLTHGNIVPVFDMGQHEEEFYIAMEYIAGVDLRSLLKRLQGRAQRLPVSHALYVIGEVLKGLSYAHRKADEDGEPLGIIHRDVSPSNILISTEGEVKLVDFGIAKAASRSTRSVTGRLQGKFGYMSPEQARGGALDARSDLFSAGVVLYEMLTGLRPFDGATDLEILDRVRTHEPEPPSALRAEIPASVDALVAAALEKSPEDRPESADALLEQAMGALMEMGEAITASAFVEGLEARLDAPFAAGVEALRVEDALDLEIDAMLAAQGGSEGTRTMTASAPGAETAGEPSAPETPPPGEGEEEAAQGEPASVAPDGPEPMLAEDASPEERRRRSAGLLWIVAALLLAGAALGGWLWWQQRPGSLSVQSDVPGAQITVDGAPVEARQVVRVEPGAVVRVRVEGEGYAHFEQEVVLEPGQAKEIFASLDALEPEVPREPPRDETEPEPPLEVERRVLFVVRPPSAEARLTLAGEPLRRDVPVPISTQNMSSVQVEAEGFETCAFVLNLQPLLGATPSMPGLQSISGCAGVELSGEITRGSTLAVSVVLEPALPVGAEADATDAPDVEEVEPRRKPGSSRVQVALRSAPEGARVRIDGGPELSLPHTLELRRRGDKAKVRVRLEGHLDETFTLDPRRLEGREVERVVRFEDYVPLIIGVRWADGAMAYGDRITVNGQRVASGSGQSAQIRVAPGRRYTIRAVNTALGVEGERDIEVEPDAEGPVRTTVSFPQDAPLGPRP